MLHIMLQITVMVSVWSVVSGFSTASLSGMWDLSNGNGSIKVTGCELPGGVHICLLKAGVIPEPYLNSNDVLLQWVALDDW